MADVTLPLGVITAALAASHTALLGAIGWLVRERGKDRRERRADKRRYAYALKQAKFFLERSDGVPSSPPPSIDQWKDDSAIIDAETMEAERYMERRQQGMDAADRTPEHVSFPRRPKR